MSLKWWYVKSKMTFVPILEKNKIKMTFVPILEKNKIGKEFLSLSVI